MFLIDAVSIYITIIFTIMGAVTLLYSIYHIDSNEKFSERYYSIMLITVGCVIGTALAGDLLTLFIFWEATAAGSSFLMMYRKTAGSLHATLKIFGDDNNCFSFHNLRAFSSLCSHWHT
jgi:formate hydrogenlyase subunit 3/multisubunit Na+/H+ antiporter MnhD subunit